MERDIAGAADRLLTLLTLLQNSTGITVSEAAEKIGVNRSNAYRSLRKLEEYGFAAKSGRKYAAGPRLMPDSFLTPYAVAQYSGTIMKELVMTTGISAHLCMLSPRDLYPAGGFFRHDPDLAACGKGRTLLLHRLRQGHAVVSPG